MNSMIPVRFSARFLFGVGNVGRRAQATLSILTKKNRITKYSIGAPLFLSQILIYARKKRDWKF